MKDNNKVLSQGIKTVSIAIAIIILAPILLTMGFKGVRLENAIIGYVLLFLGFILVITGMILLVKGIKYFLDYWFENEN